MNWRIQREPQGNANRIRAHWEGAESIYDAALEVGEASARTSFGGSTSTQLSRFDPPLVGIFRWSETAVGPTATLMWRAAPDGEMQTEIVPLG